MAMSTAAKEIRISSHVRCVSGSHSGRQGIVTQLRPVQLGTNEPETYAVVAYEETDFSDRKYTDHFCVPVRRLESL